MKAELRRILSGPMPGENPSGLGSVRFIAKCDGNAPEVLQVAKLTLQQALHLTEDGKFSEEVWAVELPKDFVKNCRPKHAQAEVEFYSRLTLEERIQQQTKDNWSVYMFMNSFLPSLEMRYWSWWDATILDKDHIAVAVEVSEWPFPWESLRWLFRGSGAVDLTSEP